MFLKHQVSTITKLNCIKNMLGIFYVWKYFLNKVKIIINRNKHRLQLIFILSNIENIIKVITFINNIRKWILGYNPYYS